MKRWIILSIIGFGVIAVASALLFYASITGFSLFGSASTSKWQPITITQTNVASVLSRTSLVHDIPQEGVIAAYVGEKGYTIRKGVMEQGVPSNPDVTVRLPESYLEIMGQYGPCAAFATARNNGELAIEMHQSTSSLAWKYRGLARYKSCLG